jgi:hypothetical protein
VRNTHTWLLFAVCLLLAGIASPQSDEATLYLYDATPYLQTDLRNLDDVKNAWDECHFLFSLQGIVNRDRPRLFVRYVNRGIRGKTINLDDYWLEKLRQPGEMLAPYRLTSLHSLDEVVKTFRSSFRGVVCYDPNLPATSNLASTIAGVENLPCLRYDPAPNSLYDRLVNCGPKLPVLIRLYRPDGSTVFTPPDRRGNIPGTNIPSTGSPKCDAYLWAKQKYLDSGKCNPAKLAYYIDACWLEKPAAGGSITNNTLSNHDYFVANKAFFFDLSPWDDETPVDSPDQPLHADRKTLQSILLSAYKGTRGNKMIHIGGFVPWAWKYTKRSGGKNGDAATEWKFVQIASAYNAYLDADALGMSALVNASVYKHMKLDPIYPQGKPTIADLKKKGLIDRNGNIAPKHYISFYVGDYDSAAWLYQNVPLVWDDPARGSVPLGWAFNPNLADRLPVAMVYTRRTKSPNDSFVAGDSGAGYLNPGMLQQPREFSGLPQAIDLWRDHCLSYYRQWDLSITGFIIDGYAPAMSGKTLQAYSTFSPDGIVAQKVPDTGIFHNMPLKRMDSDIHGDPKHAAQTILSYLKGDPPQFYFFRSILKTPTWYRSLFSELTSARPDLSLLDPHSFFLLLHRCLQYGPRER